MNAKKEILKLTKIEDIEAISISKRYKVMFFEKDKVEEALKELDFEFDSGYGLEEGPDIIVWTKDKIIVKGCYDGSEWYVRLPRHPDKKFVPFGIGGG
ncbi:MAG: hypothetical protein ACTSVB_04035 [Candidatus Heimdallarchaeaceae archaeon]